MGYGNRKEVFPRFDGTGLVCCTNPRKVLEAFNLFTSLSLSLSLSVCCEKDNCDGLWCSQINFLPPLGFLFFHFAQYPFSLQIVRETPHRQKHEISIQLDLSTTSATTKTPSHRR